MTEPRGRAAAWTEQPHRSDQGKRLLRASRRRAENTVPLDLDALRSTFADLGEPFEPLDMGGVMVGPGALGQLGDVIGQIPRDSRTGAPDVVVLAAATDMTVGGSDLREAIEERIPSGCGREWIVLGPPDGSLHADERTVGAARRAAAGAGCVVTVGSGTVTDIGKAAARAGTHLIAVQTATSVNGYADPFSVLLTAGVKRTTPTRWPDWLIVDTDVLADAPDRLNLAGVGDMAAMFTATADWYLASFLGAGGPRYRAEAVELVRPHGQATFDLGRGLTEDQGQLADLARLLTLGGIGMGITGSTAPASGTEHAVGHLLEMSATASEGASPTASERASAGASTGASAIAPHAASISALASNLHGEQVGVASVVAAAAWEHVRARIAGGGLGQAARLPDPDATADRIRSAFAALDPSGAMAAECLADYTAKIRLISSGPDPLAKLRSAWADLEPVFDRLLTGPAELAAGLRSAGLPARFGDLPVSVDQDQARWAVASCALQRRRFGVVDLAMLMGAWEDDDVDAVLAAAGSAADSAAECDTRAGAP